jgi:hypothetical protein
VSRAEGGLLTSALSRRRPAAEETLIGLSLSEEVELRDISRRDFLGFCASMA